MLSHKSIGGMQKLYVCISHANITLANRNCKQLPLSASP